MTPSIIQAIFANIVLPEIADWLTTRRAGNQAPPTKDELLAEMNTRADAILTAGEAFLRAKGAL